MPHSRAIAATDPAHLAWAEGLEEREGFLGPVPFVASTEGKKKDGHDLRAESWDLSRYREYSPILYGHDFQNQRPPIGLGTAEVVGRELVIGVYYDADDEFAVKLHNKAVKRMIGGSVSWDTYERGRRNELIEFSMVNVPLDPQSLPMRQARALRSIADEMAKMLDELEKPFPINKEDPLPDVFRGVGSAMAALAYGAPAIEDDTRRQLFDALEPVYRLLGKVPPVWRTARELQALTTTQIRGLMFAGEQDFIHVDEPSVDFSETADKGLLALSKLLEK